MDTIEAIMTRRCVRSWEDKPVPDDIIKKILAAAMQAPSARNEQPWHFIVITDRDQLQKLSETAPGARPAANAPLAIMVCGDESLELSAKGYWMQDCAAAMQNLLLAAKAEGLGAVWTGGYPNLERAANLSRVAELPDNVHPMCTALIGYPTQTPEPENRFKEERIHYNRW